MKTGLVSVLIAAALFCGCGDEEQPVGSGAPPGKTFQPLTAREHVLNNLELAYTQQKYSPYAELLDPAFTFFFSPGDVGGNIPEQWGRTEELSVAARMFDKSLNEPPYPTCRSIRMDLKFENGVQWVEVKPDDFPDETWYTTTVYYEFTFEMLPDMTFIAVPGSQAQFTVRNAGTEDAPQWRLVEWRDVGPNSAAPQSSVGISDRSNPTGESPTWGRVKALYIG
jgi:hypothetical protein